MSRECGKCTMCCKVMGVKPPLDKPAGVWCVHCDVGKGCKIYDERPQECREFECLWLLDDAWPEEVRPDRSHVVMSTTLDGTRLVANVDPTRPDAYASGRMGEVLSKLANKIDVLVVVGDQRRALTTPRRRKEIVKLISRIAEGTNETTNED